MSSNTITNYRTGLPGERYTRLLVLGEADFISGQRKVTVRCDCGTEKGVWLTSLRSGDTQSCGCLGRERSTTHGKGGTPEHHTWKSMVQRCTNPAASNYHNYGGRGITVASEWRGPDGFEAFLEHVGTKPTPAHSLDRIDNEKGYMLGNCQWATRQEQNRNSRRNKMLTFQGEIKCQAEWAELSGVSRQTIYDRLKAGWSVERALTQPVMGAR